MPLRIAPFQPSAEDKARINAVAEAIALNRLYRPVSAPLVSSSTRDLVQAAAEEVGADPLPVRAPQQRVSERGTHAERHGREYVRLVRAVLREVALGRGGQPETQALAEQAQRHEALMRAVSGEDRTRRQHDGSMFLFKDRRGAWAFTLGLKHSSHFGHLWPIQHSTDALAALDDDALASLGRWCSSVSPEERTTPGRVPDSDTLIYRMDRGTLTLRSTVAAKYPGLAQALHLLALSAWPVEVPARSD